MKNKSLILLSSKNYFNEIKYKYNFKGADIELVKLYTPPEREELAKKINKYYSKIYFYDFDVQFNLLIPLISKKVERNWILSYVPAEFCNIYLYAEFLNVIEFKERKSITNIYALNEALYVPFKDKYNFKLLKLDYSKKLEKKHTNSIGILSIDYDEEQNFFNQISAISLTDYKNVNVLNSMYVTNEFCKDFNLTNTVYKKYEDLIINSDILLYCNFANFDICLFLLAMDNNKGCILGNCSLFDNYPVLKKYLVLESDDDVDEIADKIINFEKNRNVIFEEYKKFRNDYSKESKKIIDNLMK